MTNYIPDVFTKSADDIRRRIIQYNIQIQNSRAINGTLKMMIPMPEQRQARRYNLFDVIQKYFYLIIHLAF